uniref:Proline rich mitotic checkpoint control factor n=1 Tax=Cavia porcellus TaxID=10141 RepID=A0A286X929_CAVPO|nr:proline-rich protein PRCC [Cavia porcellus]
MSLVAYASSDESEPDEGEPEPEEEEAAAPTPGPTLGGLFASLPAPKGPALLPPPPQMLAPAFPPPMLLPPPSGDPRLQPPPPLPFGLGGFPPPPGVSPAEAAGVGEGMGLGLPGPRGPGLSLPAPVSGAGPPLGLPKPKKRTEPVKIAAPELHKGDSDSEEDEPTKKKIVLQVRAVVRASLHACFMNFYHFWANHVPSHLCLSVCVCFFPLWLQDYYSGGYYPAQDPALVPSQEIAPDASFIDDEAFKRLQGKRNRGREEINFVEIKGDDQLSGAQQWMTKSLTEEKTMRSFSKKKGEQPTGQQRRKHQITYLIHQAKERELELKNTWSENKLSRRQTQAKYGF